MKLVREAISFQRYKDPKRALFGQFIPGKIYSWYFDDNLDALFMMFVKYDENPNYPLKVYEFARGYQGNIVFNYPEENNVLMDALHDLTQEQAADIKWKLDHLDDEEQEFIRMINEETGLVPFV